MQAYYRDESGGLVNDRATYLIFDQHNGVLFFGNRGTGDFNDLKDIGVLGVEGLTGIGQLIDCHESRRLLGRCLVNFELNPHTGIVDRQ